MLGGVTRHMLPHLPEVPHLHENRPLNIPELTTPEGHGQQWGEESLHP